MKASWKRAAMIAAVLYLVLFLIRFMTVDFGSGSYFRNVGMQRFEPITANQAADSFAMSRKNYASAKMVGFAPGAAGMAPESQKYEKVGTLTQVSTAFDADRARVGDLIKAQSAIVQREHATGLKGWRALWLGIGVPPDKFDAFIEAARAIGSNVGIDVVKNDKTNEYLQLRAKRQTLEKARSALEELKAGGGSIEERVNVQSRLTEIEQQIQELGVSLGEFDSQNELCTVKLTLREEGAPKSLSFGRRVLEAMWLSLGDYALLGIGFLAATVAAFLALMLADRGLRLLKREMQA